MYSVPSDNPLPSTCAASPFSPNSNVASVVSSVGWSGSTTTSLGTITSNSFVVWLWPSVNVAVNITVTSSVPCVTTPSAVIAFALFVVQVICVSNLPVSDNVKFEVVCAGKVNASFAASNLSASLTSLAGAK